MKDRREILRLAGIGLTTTALSGVLAACTSKSSVNTGVLKDSAIPAYLADYADIYATNPRAAAHAWFKSAGFGMFIHYGLYSILGGEWRGKQIFNTNKPDQPVAEWAQYYGRIGLDDYASLAENFTANKFDVDFITDLTLEAGMKYINLTTRHHDSFCLFETAETDFHSMNTPAKRDLVGELAQACNKKGLGLFLYYSHGRDWKHPHAPATDWAVNARPHYTQKELRYAEHRGEHDILKYVEFMERQITELLTNYGPVAGIWLDGEGVLKTHARRLGVPLEDVVSKVRLADLYAKIRKLQPNCLVSYKQGVEGSEDFLTPERTSFGLDNSDKMLEINTTLQAHSWGYNKFTKHRKTPDEIMELLAYCKSLPANCCLNTGPMGDGSLVPEEIAIFREVGKRRRASTL